MSISSKTFGLGITDPLASTLLYERHIHMFVQ